MFFIDFIFYYQFYVSCSLRFVRVLQFLWFDLFSLGCALNEGSPSTYFQSEKVKVKTLLEGQTLQNKQIKPGWRVSTVIKIHSAFTKQHKNNGTQHFLPQEHFYLWLFGSLFPPVFFKWSQTVGAGLEHPVALSLLWEVTPSIIILSCQVVSLAPAHHFSGFLYMVLIQPIFSSVSRHPSLPHCTLQQTHTHTCTPVTHVCVFLAAGLSSCLPLLISVCAPSLPLWPSVILSKPPELQSFHDCLGPALTGCFSCRRAWSNSFEMLV